MDVKMVVLGTVVVLIFSVITMLLNRLAGRSKPMVDHKVSLNSVYRNNKLVGSMTSEENFKNINGWNTPIKKKVDVYPVIVSSTPQELILKVHESINLKDIRSSARSLGSDLYSLNLLSTPHVFIWSSDKLDTYKIRAISQQEEILFQLLNKSGLVKRDTSGDEVWPDIRIDERGIIYLTSSLLNIAEVEKASKDFQQLGRAYEMVEQDGSVFKLSPIGAFESFLEKGESVLSKAHEYLEKYVEPNKNIPPRWFLGVNQVTGEEIWRELIDTPAMIVAGGSGAGKTETVKSILFNLVATHPNTKIYTYDGSAKTTWNSIADTFSPYRLAVPVEGSVAREAFFLIDQMFIEYKKRIELFKQERADNIITFEKKTGKKLPRIVLLLEEFPVFANELYFEQTHLTEGSGAYKLKRLMQESRSYGFAYVFLTQTANGNTIPPLILNNMLVVAHKSSETASQYFDLPLQTLPTGSYYIKTDLGKILCRNHYLGAGNDTFDKLLDIAQIKATEHKKEIDPNFVQVTKSEKDRSEFAPLLKSALIKEGHTVKQWDNGSHSSVAGVTQKDEFQLCFAFLKKDELSSIHVRTINPDNCTHLLLFCEFAVDEKKELELIKRTQEFEFGNNKVVFVTDSIWKRIIYQMMDCHLPQNIMGEFIRARTNLIVLADEPQRKLDIKEDVGDDHTNADPEISVERLNKLKNLKGKGNLSRRKKGKAFESFLAGLFEKKGYKVVFGEELKKQKYTFNQPGDGDGGLDLVAINSEELILIQAKNWAWPVSNDSVQQIIAAKATLEGLRSDKVTKLVVATTGSFTPPTIKQASLTAVELWDYGRLIQEIKLIEEPKKPRGRPRKILSGGLE